MANAEDRITIEGDNEATAYPWWAIVQPEKKGTAAIGAGPFFSRKSAQDYLEGHRYRYSKKAYVYCFSGNQSPEYRAKVVLNGKR